MKLLLVLLIATTSASAQYSRILDSVYKSISERTIDTNQLYHRLLLMDLSKYDPCYDLRNEMYTIRQINDSLRAKLNTAMQYISYTAPVMNNIYLKNRAGARILKFCDHEAFIRSMMRFQKRYKNKCTR